MRDKRLTTAEAYRVAVRGSLAAQAEHGYTETGAGGNVRPGCEGLRIYQAARLAQAATNTLVFGAVRGRDDLAGSARLDHAADLLKKRAALHRARRRGPGVAYTRPFFSVPVHCSPRVHGGRPLRTGWTVATPFSLFVYRPPVFVAAFAFRAAHIVARLRFRFAVTSAL